MSKSELTTNNCNILPLANTETQSTATYTCKTKSSHFSNVSISIRCTAMALMLSTSSVAYSVVYNGTNPSPLPGTVGDYYSYTLGTYLSGGVRNGYNPFPPSDSYRMPSPKGMNGAANELDWHWIQGNPIYDIGFSSNLIFMFPTGDHGPYPQDNVEAQVYGSNNLGDSWVAASLNNVYRDGWIDYLGDGAASIEADDWASEWVFPNGESYRYIYLNQTHFGPDGDMEVDAIGALVPLPASVLLFSSGIIGLIATIRRKVGISAIC